MRERLPDFLKRAIIDTDKTRSVRTILKNNCLSTVCENARCPNKNECYTNGTATFLIMGNVCTRNCRYCNIACAKPDKLNLEEPANVAKAVEALRLKYAVITSVTRDDLNDGGASHFSNCIYEIRKLSPNTKIEILTPDFKNNKASLDIIIEAHPDVFNHNIEVVKSIFNKVRPQGNYDMSLKVLAYIKSNSDIITKSGLMIGLGETFEEIRDTLIDLKNVGCDIITIGQYIQPSKGHVSVSKYYSLEEYKIIEDLIKSVGIKKYQIGPLVRSSYNASNLI